MALTDAERLRGLLNDTDADDYLVSDEQIEDLLAEADGDPERAALGGWRIKAAKYADLVDITEGNASRKMSQLYDHAEKMIKLYSGSRGGPTEGRTRIGRIVRGQ
jgi:hypothetical protein